MICSIQIDNIFKNEAETEIEFFDIKIIKIIEKDFRTTFNLEVHDETEEAFITNLESSYNK